RPVGQRELQVAGDQTGVQRLTAGVGATGDDGQRLHAGQVEPAQGAQQLVLVAGEVGRDLLDGDDAAGQPREAHDVPGDPTRQCGEDVGGPVLQPHRPGQVEQCRVGSGGGDVQGHGGLLAGPGPGEGLEHCRDLLAVV